MHYIPIKNTMQYILLKECSINPLKIPCSIYSLKNGATYTPYKYCIVFFLQFIPLKNVQYILLEISQRLIFQEFYITQTEYCIVCISFKIIVYYQFSWRHDVYILYQPYVRSLAK